MKGFQILLILTLVFCAQIGFAQVSEKTYEITISLTDADGKKEVKELVIKGDMSQEELDALIQEQISGAEGEVDVNVNVDVNGGNENDVEGNGTKTITKIIKQRNNLSEEEKIIIEEHDMEIEVKGDKVYINGEQVKEGDFGDKKVRILKFEEGEDVDLENLLEGEDIEIGKGEKIFFIESEESSEGVAFLGVTTYAKKDIGQFISKVTVGSSAEKVGLQRGDIIKSIDNIEIDGYSTLSEVVKSHLPGEVVQLVYTRDGIANEVSIALSDYDKFVNERNNRGKRHGHREVDFNTASLGVILKDSKGEAIVIDKVLSKSAAEKAGLQSGDIITKIDKADMLSVDQAVSTIKAHEVGDEIKLKIIRDGKKKTLRAILERPPSRIGNIKNNTSNTVERIIIKKTDEDARVDFETSGAIKLSDFDLSPNPSQGDINVRFNMDPLQVDELLNVRIISIDGKVIEEMTLDTFDGIFNENFDLSNNPSGIYLFQAEKNKQKFMKRFVIKRN